MKTPPIEEKSETRVAQDFNVMRIPESRDIEAHKRLLASQGRNPNTLADLAVVSRTESRNGDFDVVTVDYEYSGNGSTPKLHAEYVYDHVPRGAEREAWLVPKLDVGAKPADYSWKYELKQEKGGTEFDVKCSLRATGRKTIVRIVAPMLDASGKPVDPSRSDPAYYGSSAPPSGTASPPPAQPASSAPSQEPSVAE